MCNVSKAEEKDMVQEIRERYPEVAWPEVSAEKLQLAGWHDMDAIPGRVANVIWTKHGKTGEDIPNVVGVRSDEYKFIRYEVLTKKFEEVIDRYEGAFGKPVFDFAFPKDGARFLCNVDFPEMVKPVRENGPKVGQDISPRCGFKSSLDMCWEYATFIGAIRLICTNGMVAYQIESQMNKKHRQTLDVDDINQHVIPTLDRFDEQVAIWGAWAETEFTALQTEKLVDALPFGNRHTDEILALPEKSTQETLNQWMAADKVNKMAFHNVATQFLSHEVESEMVRVEKAQKVARIFHNHEHYLKAA